MLGSGKGVSGVVGISRNGSGAGTFPDRFGEDWRRVERSIPVRIGSPSHYQGVDKAGGTQVDIQSEEKASSDCTTIYKVVWKLLDHMTFLGTWYGP